MKNKILILICLLFLSGCSATYELDVKGDKIKERLTLIETNQSLFDVPNDSGWTLRQMFESLVNGIDNEFSVEDYSVKSLSDDNQLGVEYYSDEAENIINSSVINQCYTNPKVTKIDNTITINTGDDFKCYQYYENLDEIKVIFKTNNKVISSNADMVEDDKYIWNITKEGNKQIEISYEEITPPKNNFIGIIIIVSIILIGCLIVYYIYIKKNKENEI